MPVYRKKLDAVDAVQWTGANTAAIRELVGREVFDVADSNIVGGRGLIIPTPEGGMAVATPRDWVIREPLGELYACSPDVFAATYEPLIGVAVTLDGYRVAGPLAGSGLGR